MSGKELPDDHFGVYANYSSSLRGWFIAYGVGFFVLVFGNDTAQAIFRSAPSKSFVAVLFVLGVISQLILVFLNKYLMWSNYWALVNADYSKTCRAKICAVLSEKIWIDLTLDLFSLFAYGVATLIMIYVNLG